MIIIKSHDIKFVEYHNIKQTKGILEVSIKTPLEAMVKTNHFDYVLNSKSNNKDSMGDLGHGRGQQHLTVQPSSSSTSILTCANLFTSNACELTRQQTIDKSTLTLMPSKSIISSTCMVNSFHTNIK